MSAITFQVDVSRTFRNKEGYEVGGYKLNTSFKTEPHTPETFLDSVVREGWPYTMVFNHERWPAETGAVARGVKTPKHIENFISRQELTADDDSQAPGVIDFWLHDSFFSAYGFAFVESVNSIPGQAEKGHPTLIFDHPITCPKLYKESAKALAWKYPQLDQGIHNIDRTIYNAQGARIHPLGNICPFDVFECEILTPYREHLAEQARIEAEYQARRKAQLDQARADGRVKKDAKTIEDYLTRSLNGIFDFVASQGDDRHSGIFWAGVKVGELEAADWTQPFSYLFSDSALENRITLASESNGYLTHPNGGKAEILRTFADGRAGGASSPAPEPELYERKAPEAKAAEPTPEVQPELEQIEVETQPKAPGPKELARLAVREQYLASARTERAEKEAQRQARQAELERRWQVGNCVNFDGDEEIDPDQIQEMRARFTSARKWRDYVLAHWPDVDEDEQFRIKTAENREARPGTCGEWRKKTLPNGQVISTQWTCGLCPGCLKRSIWIYRRALNEIQGLPPEQPTAAILSLASLESDPGSRYYQPGGGPEAPRENAPPLPQVKGELSIVRIEGDQERLRIARELRTAGIAYRAQPITLEDGPAYDFIVNDDRGDPLGLMVTDGRIELWVKGAEHKRASGELLPSLKKLQQRYREALPYEVVCPELDDEGQPVDPDIFVLELPDIGTTARLPGVTVEFEVHDAETLQAALLEIHQEQWRILGRRGAVNYGVCIHKKFYTRYMTLPRMLADFNTEQAAIRQRRRKK